MKSENDEITEYMRKYERCPDCGGSDFMGGPSGGMCQNIMCAGCGARFNMSPFGVERIGDPKPTPEGCIPARFEIPVLGWLERIFRMS